MGFNSVYRTLQELFPQVDARILRAVAIEHSKDPDGAVDSVLTEVLPFVSSKSNIPTSVVKNNKMEEITAPCSSVLGSVAVEDANVPELLNDGHNIDSLCLSERTDESLASSFYDATDTYDQPGGNTKNEELTSFKQSEETGVEDGQGGKLDVTSVYLIGECSKGNCDQPSINRVVENLVVSHECQDAAHDLHVNNTGNARHMQLDSSDDLPSYDHNLASLENRDSADQASVSVKDQMSDPLGWDLQPEPESGMPLSDGENQEMSSYIDADVIEEAHVTDSVDRQDETVLSTIVTRSGQICRINLLEDMIEAAKKHKETLLFAMESVIRLIKGVELHEKEAEQAKEAAARGGLEILEKVEEMKKMLQHAKEANDMHAGEVYGEKSILATEVRELQTRLLGLSDEKDKSLSILAEMRRILEARIAVAEEERRAAEQEMLEKEEIARAALAEQELIMEKVVEESKLLQKAAEENAKLQDFLMEKGHVVDILQGEISVICQDVELLKENFDNRVSLGKCLSRQSSRLLASSSSSAKSMASDPAPEQPVLPESPPRRVSPTPSVECQTPRSIVGLGNETVRAGDAPRKELLDEDWELFDF